MSSPLAGDKEGELREIAARAVERSVMAESEDVL